MRHIASNLQVRTSLTRTVLFHVRQAPSSPHSYDWEAGLVSTTTLDLCFIPNHHRLVQRNIINPLRTIQHLINYRRISLSKFTRGRSYTHIPATHPRLHSARSNIQAMDGAVEQAKRNHRLIKGDFVAWIVYACESEVGGLAYLAVGYIVGGQDVGEASRWEARGLQEVIDDGLATDPVAYVVWKCDEFCVFVLVEGIWRRQMNSETYQRRRSRTKRWHFAQAKRGSLRLCLIHGRHHQLCRRCYWRSCWRWNWRMRRWPFAPFACWGSLSSGLAGMAGWKCKRLVTWFEELR